ncbi:SLAP domain-containing protein [Pseudalkalibacillus berkeleyi]|uniref:SLAP domain-containing protein n=1 Tax=Pseudalkalibacillus berkeleyi TaxID=1069813 RepID=A0ABS9H5A9_9BACL|nr:SLAP domain-containing protein [Pseudalkalibacillus berkeleyi]MCF6138983.1 SLAP domain-containing protein [Pseudalkalibacillus berkeleyi]
MEERLLFDPAWEKAIAPRDRESIEQLHQSHPVVNGELSWTPINVALNHQGSILAMVLIQNGLEETFTAENLSLIYREHTRGVVAEANFQLKQVQVPSGASMPWTFVFPEQTVRKRPRLSDWQVEVAEKIR